MQTKLILIEGIPGSGKTTIAGKVNNYLNAGNIKTQLFCEGDIHPADLSWCAYIPLNEYENILSKNVNHLDVIRKFSKIEKDYAIVAYTKMGLLPNEVKDFAAYEVYDGRVPAEKFMELHQKRWKVFCERAHQEADVNIFECAYFQNSICELMGIHMQPEEKLCEYLLSLMNIVEKLNPVLIYLTQPDIKETISRVAKERISPDKAIMKDWIDMVIDWVENSKYGKINNLKGLDGTIRFFEDRKRVELSVLEKLPIKKYIINNPDYNWDSVFNDIKEILI